jgi:hypothetical protein
MRQQGAKQQRPDPDNQIMLEIIQGVARSLALSVEVFLHTTFGSAYVGCGLFGFVLIFLFSRMFPDQNLRPLLFFTLAYGVLWLVASINVLIRWWGGRETVASRYNGTPLLCKLLPFREMTVKHMESVAVILLGMGIHALNQPLGDYLTAAGVFVLIRGYSFAAERRARAVQLNDSVIEQTAIGDQFREMQQR